MNRDESLHKHREICSFAFTIHDGLDVEQRWQLAESRAMFSISGASCTAH